MRDRIQQKLNGAVEDNTKAGAYRVTRDIFTDPEIFELEMEHIFEGNWIYLAHESQIPTKMITSPPIWAASPSSLHAVAMAN